MQQEKQLGILLILGSAIAYSLSGYFTRLIELDVWMMLFWRGIFGGTFIGAYVCWRHRFNIPGAFRAMGMAGLWVTALSTVATISFITALRLSPVADVMTIHAAIPFLTAVLAFAFTGTREGWATWGASLLAFLGVAIMVNPQGTAEHLMGNALAGIMALSYAAMMVIIRRNGHVSMLPAACLSAFACSLVVLPWADPANVGTPDLVALLLFGTVQFGLGLLLMTLGTRLISATRSALVGSLENPLAPFWVWLAFGEAPAQATWIGGIIVMTAVLGEVLVKSWRAPAGSGNSSLSAESLSPAGPGSEASPGRGARSRPSHSR
ncbi:DMT family transporter [Mesorhizobium sp. UC22_110]|uniref:DMT family transporter n=1 Tax=unclassified Mesorhizobium TaxID=325217 RepID=UPI003672F14D